MKNKAFPDTRFAFQSKNCFLKIWVKTHRAMAGFTKARFSYPNKQAFVHQGSWDNIRHYRDQSQWHYLESEDIIFQVQNLGFKELPKEVLAI